GHDFLLATLALFPRRQCQHHKSVIGSPARASNGVSGLDFTTFAQGFNGSFNPVELRLKKFYADPLRAINTQQRDRAILCGGKFLPDHAIADIGCTGENHSNKHDQKRRRKGETKAAAIKTCQPAANGSQEGRTVISVSITFFEQARCEHRTKGERNHGGKQDGDCQYKSEFAKQPASLSRQK